MSSGRTMEMNGDGLKRRKGIVEQCGDATPQNSVAEYQIIEAPHWDLGVGESNQNLGLTMFQRLFHWGPVTAISITFCISISTIYAHLSWWPLRSVGAYLHFMLFLFFNYLTLFNLSRSAIIGPGYAPLSWFPPDKEYESRLQYCRICKGYKPPRSHHCSKCGRCVLKMDHHCPWINNCVGHLNHALFVRFLAAAVAGCIHAAIIIMAVLYRFLVINQYMLLTDADDFLLDITMYAFIFIVFSFGLALGVIISVGFLLVMQLRGIVRNRTGIEDYIVNKADARERTEVFVYPYNLGWRRNVKEVLGTWDGMPKGNGVWWPVNYPATQFTFSEEQLLQKLVKREHAFEVVIVRNFGGGYCSSLAFGPRVFFCQPWFEERLQEVRVGEHWMITRCNKYWIYGSRLGSAEVCLDGVCSNGEKKEELIVRGWFPSLCAHKT